MGSQSPETTALQFFERFNAGDIKGFCQLFAEDAVFTYDGQQMATGREQIARAIEGFFLAGLQMRGRAVSTYVNGDIALTRIAWELHDAKGNAMASGVSTEVQRREADGLWRYIIDDAAGGSRAP
jgi:uncharacterized protein (TIGR02246 family)